MVEKAFLGNENYLKFFKEIDEMHQAVNAAFEKSLAEIYAKYGDILENDSNQEFLIPEIPKVKKDPKENRKARASRRNKLKKNETIASKASVESKETPARTETCKIDSIGDGGCRRSARVAKAKAFSLPPKMKTIERELDGPSRALFPVVSENDQSLDNAEINVKEELVIETPATNDSIFCTFVKNEPLNLSNLMDNLPEQIPKTPLEETICTEDFQNPFAFSTPTTSPEQNLTLPSTAIAETVEEPGSVKKKIEEFEKRTKPQLQPTKLPLKTPEKKKVAAVKPKVVTKPAVKISSKTRVLREKNTNVPETVMKKTVKQNTNEIKRKEPIHKPPIQREEKQKPKKEPVKPKIAKDEKKEPLEYDVADWENGSSDDEEHPKKPIPTWAKKEVRDHHLNVQSWLNKEETVYRWFHNDNLKNPKLHELFSSKVNMRPRMSSAVWNNKTYLN